MKCPHCGYPHLQFRGRCFACEDTGQAVQSRVSDIHGAHQAALYVAQLSSKEGGNGRVA
jgi:predicted ATP-dependent serine protease